MRWSYFVISVVSGPVFPQPRRKMFNISYSCCSGLISVMVAAFNYPKRVMHALETDVIFLIYVISVDNFKTKLTFNRKCLK